MPKYLEEECAKSSGPLNADLGSVIICSEQIWSNCKYRTNITKYQNSIFGEHSFIKMWKCSKCMFHVVFPGVTKNETDLPNHSAVWNKMIQCLHKCESTYVTDTIRFHLEYEPGFRKSWNDQFPPDASTQPVLFSGGVILTAGTDH